MTSARKRWHECLDRIPCDRPTVGVELGVWRGELSLHLLAHRRRLQLHLVDLWSEASQGPRLTGLCPPAEALGHVIAIAKLSGERGRLVRKATAAASESFSDASVDFVFVDAKHSYGAVHADVTAWLPKVKPGGWIGGHDLKEKTPGVQKAVEEILGTNYTAGADATWFYEVA